MHILLIEDDRQAAACLAKGLTEAGHVVDQAADGDDGLHLALTGQYDALIVDRMLPKRDGLAVARMPRADGRDTPGAGVERPGGGGRPGAGAARRWR
jgi:two-component system OmpR family response regulator